MRACRRRDIGNRRARGGRGPVACSPFAKRISDFLDCAVVIGVQCSRFAIALFRHRHLYRLGGQHGEESEDEDQVGSEEAGSEDGEKESREEEEVGLRFQSTRSPSNKTRRLRRSARLRAEHAMRCERPRQLKSTTEGVGA
jgi:hypothetical protein